MNKILYLSCLILTILFLNIGIAKAAETMVFDSTGNYLGGCQLTDKSAWELPNDLNVSKFQVWYNWSAGESSLPVTVYKDGVKFAEFEAKRGDCDPYQQQWCNADFAINKVFPKGAYTTQIPTSKQCLKPGGTGTIRLYQSDSPVAVNEPTAIPTATSAPLVTTQPTTNGDVTPTVCSCNQVTTIGLAAGVSSILSLVISLVLRRK